MPILTTVRQSPAYLYIKTYCLCAIITIFQAAPISSQLPEIRHARLAKHKISNRRPRVHTSGKDVPDFLSTWERDKHWSERPSFRFIVNADFERNECL